MPIIPTEGLAIINESTAWTDAEAEACVAALQTQINRDFMQAWGLTATLSFVPKGTLPPETHWWLALLDNSDQADALGYHETTETGLPLGKAFLTTTIISGGIPSVVVSHELLEMLADPWTAESVMNGANTRLYAKEVCDAVEDDQWGYQIDGVTVSDFVLPTWFEDGSTPKTFDHMGHLTTGAFSLLTGGYIAYMDISGGGWQQLTADQKARPQYRAQVGSRRDRRLLPDQFWRPSRKPA
jgi:hypothetical protein